MYPQLILHHDYYLKFDVNFLWQNVKDDGDNFWKKRRHIDIGTKWWLTIVQGLLIKLVNDSEWISDSAH